jgi:acyl-CoA synthetase (AMP-forming)/AMP-acid ligase II
MTLFNLGVPLTHLNIATTMKNIINTYNLTPADRTYLVMPLFHVHGLICGLLATLLSGGSAVIPQRFSAGIFWKDFIDNKCNWYTAGMCVVPSSVCKSRQFAKATFF